MISTKKDLERIETEAVTVTAGALASDDAEALECETDIENIDHEDDDIDFEDEDLDFSLDNLELDFDVDDLELEIEGEEFDPEGEEYDFEDEEDDLEDEDNIFEDEWNESEQTGHIDTMKEYLKDIGKYKLLSAEEEIECSKLIMAGGEEGRMARDKMITANLRLVVSIAKRYMGKGMPLPDLVQSGNLGLYTAVEKFDYRKGCKFSTYATWWIKQNITRELANLGKTIRIPVHMQEKITKVKKAIEFLKQKNGTDPSVAEIVEYLNITAATDEPDAITEAEVAKIISYMNMNITSLDKPVGEEGDSNLADFIESTTAVSPESESMKSGLHNELNKALATLTEREANVIRWRFGLDDNNPHTLEEVGASLGVTRERARQIEGIALRKLRMPGVAKGLRDFLSA